MIFCYYCENEIILITKNQKEFFKCNNCPVLETKRSPHNEKISYLKAIFLSEEEITIGEELFIQNEIERQKKLGVVRDEEQQVRAEEQRVRAEEQRVRDADRRDRAEEQRVRDIAEQRDRDIAAELYAKKKLLEIKDNKIKLIKLYTKIHDHIILQNMDSNVLDKLKKDYTLICLKLNALNVQNYPNVREICYGFENGRLPRLLTTFIKEQIDDNHIAKNIACRRYFITTDERHDEFCEFIIYNKYENETASVYLSKLIYEKIKEVMPEYEDENFLIVPVPNRLSKPPSCGVSIAIRLSEYLKKPCVLDVLAKIKSTEGRKRWKLPKERSDMAEQSYGISNALPIKNKKILLVDDLYWGGSTMNKCARLLIENGARHVMCFSAGIRG